ncbi:hypothetical protein ELE36_00805 [Pseudolysobacter antarcticus]|uniref:SppA protein n=1 Tax=Pseudolysobacter antarcticus TaxID=2511995 RepID=A0A411HEW8_9GAMM|nr:hypothetical protein [Pseudolysobacter antarcticus]QBB69035.1 hypothetical protein ELE36_00805 [Pseudolysobacter antarcticus]
MTDFEAKLRAAVEAVVAEHGQRDCIVISHGISRSLHTQLSTALSGPLKKSKSCTLVLTTYGGDPNAGYRIARCLRHHYEYVRVVIPSFCKSAGTLITIAADELAIGDLGELGPLDIQVRKPSELEENSSGLDIMQALQTVTNHTQTTFQRILVESRGFGLSTKLCAEFASQVASGIAAPLFAQIDPMRLGEMQRATRVAYEYGQRLNKYRNILKEGALERLISDYPSHSFVIDRKEAVELFNKVSHLSSSEKVFCDLIWHIVSNQLETCVLIDIEESDTNSGANHEVVNANAESEVAEPADKALGIP